MLLMKARNIAYSIGERSLLDIKELSIHQGDRIGLVGKNGQGKSLLIQYLMGKTEAIPQVDFFTQVSWFEQINEKNIAGMCSHWSKLSGGEKTLAKLEKVFQSDAELLFLDEPTNNLDWQRIEEVEERLLRHDGAYVVISHDRSLLDRVCQTIWELESGKISVYSGNYSFYAGQKEMKRKQQYEAYEQYTGEKKRLTERLQNKRDQAQGMHKPPARMSNSEWQLHKNKAAAKQKKIQRVSKTIERRIERLQKVDKPFEWENVKMEYELTRPIHRKFILMVQDLKKEYRGHLLYNIDSLNLKTGSKTALIGDNGSGKTTLIRQILNGNEEVNVTEQAKFGYFEQALESLPGNQTIFEYVSKTSSLPQTMIRIILGRLHFFEADVHKKIGVLSGGERVKVALARLLTGDYNVLILDEPTNHLDLEAMQVLESLLQDYPGTVLFVTHDRRFIENTADHLWILESKTVTSFEGIWSEYKESVARQKEASENRYDLLTLETKLSELISRLSTPSPKDALSQLETEYQATLKQIRQLKKK